jgi:hypothetical protein
MDINETISKLVEKLNKTCGFPTLQVQQLEMNMLFYNKEYEKGAFRVGLTFDKKTWFYSSVFRSGFSSTSEKDIGYIQGCNFKSLPELSESLIKMKTFEYPSWYIPLNTYVKDFFEFLEKQGKEI